MISEMERTDGTGGTARTYQMKQESLTNPFTSILPIGYQ